MRLINDHFQNYKRHNIPKAQLIIADIPYNVGTDAYGSSPQWWIDGDTKNGASERAGKQFFDTDKDFRIPEFMEFTSRMLKKEPGKDAGRNQSPCMIVFCAAEQLDTVIEQGQKRGGFNHNIRLYFRKNYSPQVLKANMRPVGNVETAVILYRDKLPKFNNRGRMIFTCMEWIRDNETPSIHPTQKPVPLLMNLIELFTDPGDVVIDPVAGSGSTLLAAENLGRTGVGFEIKKEFCAAFEARMRPAVRETLPIFGGGEAV